MWEREAFKEEPPLAWIRMVRLGPPSLRTRIFCILAALVLTNAAGAMSTLWYVHGTATLASSLAEGEDWAAARVAHGLRQVLSRQGGLADAGIRPGDAQWESLLNDLDLDVERRMELVWGRLTVEEGRSLLNQVENEQVRFSTLKTEALRMAALGREEDAVRIFGEAGVHARQARVFLDQFVALYDRILAEKGREFHQRSEVVAALAWSAILLTVGMGFVLGFILVRQVLEPIRSLALGPEATDGLREVGDEVQALSHRVQHLLTDVDKAKSKLALSQEHLVASEKLATTGKLAAGVAHSIRNPLTSVKMRLFSLERALTLDALQREDFTVISEEIRHIDAIVRNFLEFSRPPKLKLLTASPSDVTDQTLQLLRHRLESYGMQVELLREGRLPECQLDPDQIKEVMANIILNACEARAGKGRITIEEKAGVMDPHGHVALVIISDDGPGVAKANLEKIFEPFFTTKGEGTGLGLPIAKRIMQEHGGWIHCRSEDGKGAAFVLGLPCKERTAWLQSS